MKRLATLFQDAQQARTALDGVKRQVADHRAQGLRLAEEGGNPDQLLGQGDQAHEQALAALRTGDPDAAARNLEAARERVEQARSTIEQVQKAKAYCEREQPGRGRETDRLRAALPQAESYHRELERGFAASSWQAVGRNFDQIRALLATFDRMADDASSLSSTSVQKYLAGSRLIGQLAQQQQIALRLMSGLGEQLNALSAVRAECQKRRGGLQSRGRCVEGYLRQHDGIVGEMAKSSLAAALQAEEQTLGKFAEYQPDWPAVRQGLTQALEEFAIAQSQAEADVRNHEQLGREFGRARQELERVAALLSGRGEDRLAANQHFRAAAEVLDQIGLDLSAPHGESARLLEQVQGAVADLEQAERLAREDIRLAGQAESVVAEAVRSIQQARSSFDTGIAVDTAAAESALDQAERLFQAQEYEQAIQQAGEAVRAARQAHQAAAQQASWRQMQADADRRRWEAGSDGSALGPVLSAGATAAAAAAGVILDQLARAAADTSAPSPPPATEPEPAPQAVSQPDAPESAQGTWQSDSAQGTW
jgi:hypothetical protein